MKTEINKWTEIRIDPVKAESMDEKGNLTMRTFPVKTEIFVEGEKADYAQNYRRQGEGIVVNIQDDRIRFLVKNMKDEKELCVIVPETMTNVTIGSVRKKNVHAVVITSRSIELLEENIDTLQRQVGEADQRIAENESRKEDLEKQIGQMKEQVRQIRNIVAEGRMQELAEEIEKTGSATFDEREKALQAKQEELIDRIAEFNSALEEREARLMEYIGHRNPRVQIEADDE